MSAEMIGLSGRHLQEWPRRGFRQIRAIFLRARERLLFSPLRDLGVISGKQDFRNFPATKFSRSRILRRFEQTGSEGIVMR